MNIRNLLARAHVALRIRRTEADIRRTYQDAGRCPDRALYYRGEVLPCLSLHLVNLRERQRRLKTGQMPVLKNMPVLGQVRTPLRLVRGA